ncbi:hypothetical protein ACH5RR_035976 [Cinchona calisaya]|uniref:Uncharacterized protein n=1 Tax=Cinchona calisaya TaxID=153742 RepID=A0ABD2Y6L7_9GENT
MSRRTEMMNGNISSKKKEEDHEEASTGGMSKVASVAAAAGIGIVAGIGIAAWGVFKIFESVSSESEDSRKKMKAPGSNGQIMYRDDFESDTASYFRELRSNKSKK